MFRKLKICFENKVRLSYNIYVARTLEVISSTFLALQAASKLIRRRRKCKILLIAHLGILFWDRESQRLMPKSRVSLCGFFFFFLTIRAFHFRSSLFVSPANSWEVSVAVCVFACALIEREWGVSFYTKRRVFPRRAFTVACLICRRLRFYFGLFFFI